jgi:AraC-like DNA-binding protein/mannose-6-phosphate isomerase-like protein (cupin superfamily)
MWRRWIKKNLVQLSALFAQRRHTSGMSQSLVFPGGGQLSINSPHKFHRCEAGWQWQPVPLPGHDLWYVLEGVGEMHWNGHSVALQAGTCFLFPPGSRPRGRHNPQHPLLVFSVHFDVPDEGGRVCPGELSTRVEQGETVRERTFLTSSAQHCESGYRCGDALGVERARLCLQQMLLQLFEEATRLPVSREDQRLDELILRIREEPGAARTIDLMARHACLSTSQLTRRFRARTGLSPNKLVASMRVQRARELAIETDSQGTKSHTRLATTMPTFSAVISSSGQVSRQARCVVYRITHSLR